MFHFICMIMSFSGLVMVNVYGAVGLKCSTVNSYGCPTDNYNGYSYAMIAIGSICSIASLAFTLAMHCMMRGVYSHSDTQVAQNQNDINMNPMNMTQQVY